MTLWRRRQVRGAGQVRGCGAGVSTERKRQRGWCSSRVSVAKCHFCGVLARRVMAEWRRLTADLAAG
ncbi:hypothetical protein O3P69_007755 [Scylla paramamosain]|uniref:Uncharacterized protein n=1 Tax=Scylla paramamosain TaxID=85552 RepID=A0AAW0UX51_SCYPA